MKKNRSEEILDHLKRNKGTSYSAQELSDKFGISARQIRNYINQINETKEIIILSDGKYHLGSDSSTGSLNRNTDSSERVAFVISRLLTEDGNVNIFDIAEELFVSEATIQTDLKKLRRRIEPFHLSLVNNDSFLSLQGTEKNKRSLASYIITNTHYKAFMSDEGNRFFDNDYQIDNLKRSLIKIFNDCSFYYNDYSLNNIILHLVITIDRLRNHYSIEETQIALNISEIEKTAADQISSYLEENYDIEINQTERNNIAAFLATNLATLDYRMINRQNISSYIENSTIDLVGYILDKITDYYLLDPFDDVFFARFCLHIDNLLKRQKIDHSVHNPMLLDIKLTYPLIFDIAVYAAQLIKEKTKYVINQDEISLIALHIGSFIESCDMNKNKVSAIYIYSDYHQFYQHNISKIQTRFDKDLNLLFTISEDDYDPDTMEPDLLISEVDIPQTIIVSPFITEQQINSIDSMIKAKIQKKETDAFIQSFSKLFKEDYFFTDVHGKDEYEVIGKLTDLLKEKGLFDDSFTESVLNREKASSTCFIKKVAIPHAIGQTIPCSFISIVTYDHAQKWGNEDIQLLILFGIAYAERKDFRFVFNHIVDMLSNETNINALCQCRSYNDTVETIQTILSNIQK
ncbi:MAG: transcription antiterminator [Erysipelotrichaceae bacterium]|nr:transcription antiterminator [Erysipelotrichaceae bacterium]